MKNFAGAVALIFLAAAATPQTARAQATDPSRWMGELADQYAGVPSPMGATLALLIWPASHDAGTCEIRNAPTPENLVRFDRASCGSMSIQNQSAAAGGANVVFMKVPASA